MLERPAISMGLIEMNPSLRPLVCKSWKSEIISISSLFHLIKRTRNASVRLCAGSPESERTGAVDLVKSAID
jgi:hypothetical protein